MGDKMFDKSMRTIKADRTGGKYKINAQNGIGLLDNAGVAPG